MRSSVMFFVFEVWTKVFKLLFFASNVSFFTPLKIGTINTSTGMWICFYLNNDWLNFLSYLLLISFLFLTPPYLSVFTLLLHFCLWYYTSFIFWFLFLSRLQCCSTFFFLFRCRFCTFPVSPIKLEYRQ